MKRDGRIYNVLFPLWMLMLFPQLWIIVLPGNFIIDSIVLLVCMSFLKIQEKKVFYKRNIFHIWGFGMIADIIGAVFLFVLMFCFELGNMGDELYLTIPALIISSVLIFVLNYWVTFKNQKNRSRMILSLVFAIITAPYTFLVPTTWLY